ncbi:MAG: putative toxin-antitoxin system toxin component, PIN family [Chloroflexota bacterium]
MIFATLDTNVLAAGTRKLGDPSSSPGRVLDHWIEGDFVLVCSVPILTELTRTLNKRYFRQHLSDEQIQDVHDMLQDEALMVELTVEVVGVASHAADDLILATAVSAGADYLVTGDQDLLRLGEYEGVRIISPRAFLDVLEQARDSDA